MSRRGDEIGRLGAALERMRPPFDEDEAVAIALEGARRGAAKRGRRFDNRAGLRGGLRTGLGAVAAWLAGLGPRWRWAVATAAAAAVVVVIALPSHDTIVPNDARFVAPGSAGTASAAADGFSIEAPEEGGMAVFQTNNPRIRVVWFYDEAGSGD